MRKLLLLLLGLCLMARPALAAPVPALPEVREILDEVDVKINAGFYQDLRLGQNLGIWRDDMVVAYGRVQSLGEDWAVVSIIRQRPESPVSVGDQIRDLTYEATLPMGLRRPLLERSQPVESTRLQQLFSVDVDHGLESDPPTLMGEYHAYPEPARLAPLSLSDQEKAKTLPDLVRPEDKTPVKDEEDASWVFDLKWTTVDEVRTAIANLEYGQRIIIEPYLSPYPEDQGKTQIRITTPGANLLGVIAKVIKTMDIPTPQRP